MSLSSMRIYVSAYYVYILLENDSSQTNSIFCFRYFPFPPSNSVDLDTIQMIFVLFDWNLGRQTEAIVCDDKIINVYFYENTLNCNHGVLAC